MDVGDSIDRTGADITDTGDTEGGDFLGRYYRRRYRSAHPRDPWESNHGPRYDRRPYGGRYVAPYVGFKFMTEVDNWRLRGKYYDDYYRNTGKRPKYYSKVLRKRIKW